MLKNAFFAAAALGAALAFAQSPSIAAPATDALQSTNPNLVLAQWYPQGTSGMPRPIAPISVHFAAADDEAACAGAMEQAGVVCRFRAPVETSECNCHSSGEVSACSVTVWCRRQ